MARKKKELPISTVLGLDPGKENFGFTVVKTRRATGKIRQFKAIRSGKVISLVREYEGWTDQLIAFKAAIVELVETHHPDLICFERFILRRAIPKGVTVEVINAMIGILGLIAAEYGIPVVPLSAVIWKNAIVRAGHDLDWYYKYSIAEAHLIDAGLIACYGTVYWLGDDDEDYFDHDIDQMIKVIESISEVPTIKRKKTGL